MTKHFLSALMLSLAVLLVGVPTAMAQEQKPAGSAPVPATVQKSWQLDFTHGKPRAILVKSVEGPLQWYWYVTYKVVNRGDDERNFIPDVTIVTEKGDIIGAGTNVPVQAFEEVKKAVGNRLLESPNEVIGRVLIGEDHARESVIIWPAFSHDVDKLSIFVAGLSGETAITPNPLTGENVVFRKTLKIDYNLPGTAGPVQSQVVEPAGETWIMR